VLVAEDHPINQTLVTELLRARGHFYAVAGNGLEVLAMLEQGEFDAILMDGQMPEMDGYQATGEIRRRERYTGRHIHIVAVTAHAMQEDRELCIAAGMDDYIAKPIEPDELFVALEKPWTKLAAEASAARAAAPDPLAGVFDLDAALKRTRGKKSLLQQMIRAFLADAPDAMRELRLAAQANDPVKIERGAHRMKGAAATLTGEAVVQAAVAVEKLAREQPLAGAERIGEAIAQLEERIEELSGALQAILDQEQA
jgi:two-component system sensor histidine kinase/response regulator